jgi:hypothetical protein
MCFGRAGRTGIQREEFGGEAASDGKYDAFSEEGYSRF